MKDNDSLAALLSVELNADLLIMLSDVDGIYSGPPTNPDSHLLETFRPGDFYANLSCLICRFGVDIRDTVYSSTCKVYPESLAHHVADVNQV